MIRGFLVGLMTANAFEWVAHKYVLHGTPRKGQPRYSPSPASMASHWAHHRMVRKFDFGDECYEQGLSHERTQLEVQSLIVLAGVMSLAWPVSKGFVAAAWYSAGRYYYVHSRSHLNPDWGRKRIPWHFDHHMNTQQDANWCVTRPWFDYIMGTRIASSRELMESNPLGIALPEFIEAPLNRSLRQWFPKVFETLESNLVKETRQQAEGFEEAMPSDAQLSGATTPATRASVAEIPASAELAA